MPPNEPALLADALHEILRDPVERERLAAAGLLVAERLSWRRVTDQILEAYEDALAAPFRPGIHGRPDRPWFGQALFDYVRDPSLRRAGRASRGPFATVLPPSPACATLPIRCTAALLTPAARRCPSRGRSSVGLERRPVTPEVAGSSPVAPATFPYMNHTVGFAVPERRARKGEAPSLEPAGTA